MRKLSRVVFLFAGVLATTTSAHAEPVKVGTFGQEIAARQSTAEGLPSDDVLAVYVDARGVVAETASGAAVLEEGRWTAMESPNARKEPDSDREMGKVYQEASLPDGARLYATEKGLFREGARGNRERIEIRDGLGRAWAVEEVRGVAVDTAGQIWFACAAGVGVGGGDAGWKFYTGEEGLPYNEFTCIAVGPGGEVWFGTTKGAIRFDGADFAYRQGLRWLPDDHVRGIAVDQNGTAYFATEKGLGVIRRQPMTLAEKAAYYEAEIEIIKRTEWGYTSEVGLARPGDKSEVIHSDSDNDGLWTSMYGAGECFAYGATKDPKAKERATAAFEALRFLQKVTQGSEHEPPRGYVARTILPADGPDPNKGRVERDIESQKGDYLWKVYEPRWPLSADGKWYWKSDTSSDELDGHYFFYPAYYDLVAESEEEKERAREIVRDLTDHLVEHGFNLVDHDGKPTRWSIYGPEELNFSEDWWLERGLKSLSILSYLAVAEHMTGDQKYAGLARELIDRHGYRSNAMISKIQMGVGSGNQSDDEMAIMCFYNLVKYTKDEALRHEILYSFYTRWQLEQPELNPFFHFSYAAFGQGASYRNPFGSYDISPWDGWLEDSIFTLKDFPLDRIGWGHRNSHRIDIELLRPQQTTDQYEPQQDGRGYRKNTRKVLPVSERFFHHWNTDPWRLDYGGNGSSLGSGTVYLLPYYMGLYHGFIAQD